MEIKIITTADGSHSLFNSEFNETYHSVHGAIQEAIHVFIKAGLEWYADEHQITEINILEAGFGTGLNALLTLDWAIRRGITVSYLTVEAHPLTQEVLHALNYPRLLAEKIDEDWFMKLHAAPWNRKINIHPKFMFEKRHILLQDFVPDQQYANVIFYDAFAPSRQPELWELPVLEKMKMSLTKEGAFVTYCAKGQLKRDLKSLGFDVQTLSGPPGKKEMIRAILH